MQTIQPNDPIVLNSQDVCTDDAYDDFVVSHYDEYREFQSQEIQSLNAK